MYAYLKGTLVGFTTSIAIVDVGGIGYQVYIPCSVQIKLPPLGSSIQFFTALIIREYSQTLYGFLNSQERDIFEILLNVSGIGPKLAISLIGHLSLENLQRAIIEEDVNSLCKVPGVGKKTAERLLVELRDKLPSWIAAHTTDLAVSYSNDPRVKHLQDAILALVSLGYKQVAAEKAVKQSMKDLSEESDLATIVANALQKI